MIKLNNKIEIIVPKEDNEGKAINSPAINNAVNKLTEIFGGCTVSEVKGMWIMDNGSVAHDNNTNYEWYYNVMDIKEVKTWLHMIVYQLINNYGQEAVSVKINNTLYILEQSGEIFEII